MTRAATIGSVASGYGVTTVTWILLTCGPSWLASASRRRTGGGDTTCTNRPCAAALRSNVATTTVECTIPSEHRDNAAGTVKSPGANIYGPLENGFNSAQDKVLQDLGCTDPSKAYSNGGKDTKVAVAQMAYECQVELPRRETVGGKEMYVNLLDECGGHTNYHFHQSFSCCYEETGTHSTQIGVGVESADDKLYGKWEDFSLGDPDGLPRLDACGGHYGPTPDNAGITYHYHVQDSAPFTFGCFGPNADGSLVTVEQCRKLYSTCGDGDEETFTAGYPAAVEETVVYDIDCPCYDADGSTLGTKALKVFDGYNGTAPQGATWPGMDGEDADAGDGSETTTPTTGTVDASSRVTVHACTMGVLSLLLFAV